MLQTHWLLRINEFSEIILLTCVRVKVMTRGIKLKTIMLIFDFTLQAKYYSNTIIVKGLRVT